ncbi:MAG: hypothetical protein AAF719_09650 [Pseudomonadota bacterium]
MDEDASILAVLYSQWANIANPMSKHDDASTREALIRAMAKTKSRSAKDLSLKLAVWAQLAKVDEIDLDRSSPEDALAYSTFLDVFDIAQALCNREHTTRKPAGTS